MVSKFVIPCNLRGQTAQIEFLIGNPAVDQHPIYYQSKWLGDVYGAVVPQAIMDSIKKIKEIADKEKISFEDLCLYTIRMAHNVEQEKNEYYDKLLIENDSKRIASRQEEKSI